MWHHTFSIHCQPVSTCLSKRTVQNPAEFLSYRWLPGESLLGGEWEELSFRAYSCSVVYSSNVCVRFTVCTVLYKNTVQHNFHEFWFGCHIFTICTVCKMKEEKRKKQAFLDWAEDLSKAYLVVFREFWREHQREIQSKIQSRYISLSWVTVFSGLTIWVTISTYKGYFYFVTCPLGINN